MMSSFVESKTFEAEVIEDHGFQHCFVHVTITKLGLHILDQSQRQTINLFIFNECIIDYKPKKYPKPMQMVTLGFYKVDQNSSKLDQVKLTEKRLLLALTSNKRAIEFIKHLDLLLQNDRDSWKPYLIAVNPIGGTGKALSIITKHVSPIFDRMNIPYEIFKTDYSGHAEEYMRKLPAHKLKQYRAIIACSGDGLIHEIFNGLASRPENKTNCHQSPPVGVLPAGTGNGLCASICYFSGLQTGTGLLSHSMYLLTLPQKSTRISSSTQVNKPSRKQTETYKSNPYLNFFPPFAKYQQISGLDGILFSSSTNRKKRLGFQCVEWGIFADVDLNSEILRWMGRLRFWIYGVYYISKRPLYRARLYYLPVDETDAAKNIRSKSLSLFAEYDSQPENTRTSERDIKHSSESQKLNRTYSALNSDASSFQWRYLPEFDQPIEGKEWVKREDEFASILVLNHPFITSSAILLPNARFDDGYMTIIILEKTMTRRNLINLIFEMESGRGLQPTSKLTIIRVKALRVESLHHKHVLTALDGEPVPADTFQAEIIPNCFPVLVGSKG